MTLGTFRPVLIFPRKYFDTVSEADFASAVAHELAHVRRHDFLLNLIYEVLRLPVSFHPAAFLIKHGLMKRGSLPVTRWQPEPT